MAGNLLQVGSDNAVRVKSDGLVVAGASDPCCCSTPITCVHCDAGAPAQFQIVISGWTTSGCINYGSKRAKQNGSIDGTYTLDLVLSDATGCVWGATALSTVDRFDDADTTCAGSVVQNFGGNVYFGWLYSGGLYHFYLTVVFNDGGTDLDAFAHIETFSPTVDCYAGWTFSNDDFTNDKTGTGGSAVITAI